VEVEAARDEGDPGVRLSLVVRNERPDHRLRLHVALPDAADGSWAIAPFEVVRRPMHGEGGTETPSPTWPARGAVLAGGVAVLLEGVFEYEVLADPAELAITLLRCVGTISRPQLATRAWPAGPDIPTPDAQMLGEHRFEIAVVEGPRAEDLPAAWERSFLPLATAAAPGGGDLPDRGSLLEVEGAELSAVRRVGGRVQVRVWNPSPQPKTARVAAQEVPLGPARIEDVEL
jgi:alpha-mannosidase